MDNILSLNQYQHRANKKARYPNLGNNITYPVLGLVGEVGEIKEIWDKIGINESFKDNEEFLLEFGDVLWYISSLARELGYSLTELLFKEHYYITSFKGLSEVINTQFVGEEDISDFVDKLITKTFLLCNSLKKIHRDYSGLVNKQNSETLVKILFDIFLLWANLLTQYEIDLDYVAELNLKKLNA